MHALCPEILGDMEGQCVTPDPQRGPLQEGLPTTTVLIRTIPGHQARSGGTDLVQLQADTRGWDAGGNVQHMRCKLTHAACKHMRRKDCPQSSFGLCTLEGASAVLHAPPMCVVQPFCAALEHGIHGCRAGNSCYGLAHEFHREFHPCNSKG